MSVLRSALKAGRVAARTCVVLVCVLWPSIAGATFSIIARDPNTGELGVAIDPLAKKMFDDNDFQRQVLL